MPNNKQNEKVLKANIMQNSIRSCHTTFKILNKNVFTSIKKPLLIVSPLQFSATINFTRSFSQSTRLFDQKHHRIRHKKRTKSKLKDIKPRY